MQTKLAGRLPLQDMISNVIADARQKLAAAEESKSEEKKEKKEEKHLAYEKKEHGGHLPSEKEEEAEHKKESSVNFSDPSEVEKLASALDYVGDLLKEADAMELGGESHQGGMVLPTAVPPKGVQPYKHDSSKKHNVPMQTGLHADPSQGKAATQMENNIHHAPGGGGTQKEAGISSPDQIDQALLALTTDGESMDKEAGLFDRLKNLVKKKGDGHAAHHSSHSSSPSEPEGPVASGAHGDDWSVKPKAKEQNRSVPAEANKYSPGVKGAVQKARHKTQDTAAAIRQHAGKLNWKHGAGAAAATALAAGGAAAYHHHKKKHGSADDVDYILNKMAESAQGGMTLDSKSGEGVTPPADSAGGNDLRKFLENNQGPVSMKKVDAKKIAKRSLADILSEPVQSKAHDSKVHENLSNASKGGVKIAQAKALLQKIASEGCTCSSKGECKYCKMKTAMAAKKATTDSAAGN